MRFNIILQFDFQRPLFRKKHIYHQSSFIKMILTSGSFLTYEGTSVYPRHLISLPLDGDVHVDRINELQVPYREGDIKCRQIVFYNTCDGLFCMSMSGGGNALLWNPTTRQVRIFQSCPSYIPKQSWIGHFLAHDLMSTSSWDFLYLRYIEESSPCDYVKYNGETTIVNGAFHWLGSNEEHFLIMPHVVVSLDISNETYGTLALPEAICDNSKGPKLCELKGKLCIFSQHIQDLHWDLWVMSEYGDVDSMMKMFRMS
ncbi:hypothetical protein CASFOL_003526 [Castilleja foliolosa]|uniref:F-box protein n=1 Tax=Castilleja foliolosa TaxID=1961234 RepID=A0ABD3EL63_9LAMI